MLGIVSLSIGTALLVAHVALVVVSFFGSKGEAFFLRWVRPSRRLLMAWWVGAMLGHISGCTHSTHVRAVNIAAVTLETTAAELRAEYERGRPEDEAERKAYAERWRPVADALSAAFAAHDAWRLTLDSGDESAILAAASRAREALCELSRAVRDVAPKIPTGALCGARTGDWGPVAVPGT